MFVVIFEDFKPCALFREPSGDRVMPHAEVPWRLTEILPF